jgi:CubicO group peptidase (beta-lactamase class C family)
METGKWVFDGVEYPDNEASDPNYLGWMQGSPPPPEKRIRFEDDRVLGFPELRWSLSHMRELAPTARVWRGAEEPSDLGLATRDSEAAVEGLSFVDLGGTRLSWAESLRRTYTDGILIMHRGRRIYERYFGALQPHGLHACFSITKSYAATLAATLLYEGVLDETKTVGHYLPEMAGSAYADATLREVMDMQIGVAYSEVYADPNADIWNYGRAGGMRPRSADYHGPGNFYEYLQTLRKEGEHGAAFSYKTVSTDVLCWVMKRVTGTALADMMGARIWSRIGCEEDAYVTVDSIGVAMGGAGLSATLRDLCRFGELLRCEGALNREQILPAAVIADIRRGSDRQKFAQAGYSLLPGYSYRNMWWVSHNSMDMFEARGIHGQRLYIAPRAELVIARFASHPVASSVANDPITLPAFAAVAQWLSKP